MTAKDEIATFSNPYDSFIEKHLKFYGYLSRSQSDLEFEVGNCKRFHYDMSNLWGDRNGRSNWQQYDPRSTSISKTNITESRASDVDIKPLSVGSSQKNIPSSRTKLSFSAGNSPGTGFQNPPPFLVKRMPSNPKNTSDLTGSHVSARWPIEMQVLNEKVHHIDYTPSIAEPLSTSVSEEMLAFRPKKDGLVVFTYPVVCGKRFTRSYNGMQQSLQNDVTFKSSQSSLFFESRFESGNLARAVQVDQYSYELYLRPDMYTNAYCQWYYFRVQNMKSGPKYRFSIVNLHKLANLYEYGMKPLMYSDRLAELRSVGWHRVGEDIFYCKNDEDKEEGGTSKVSHHTFSWSILFPYENDTVYFAHSYPYTYSDLQDYLCCMLRDPVRSQCCQVDTLCRSLAGNRIYEVTVTAVTEETVKKRVIVFTARVHPSEVPSSWVMKGLLDYVTGDSLHAQNLRKMFIFKFIPMLNPDGVIVGNSRCSLSGHDLNRTYRTLLKDLYPPTWHVRRMVRRLLDLYEVSLFCDLHGHSRRPNMFIFGCENPPNSQRHLKEQIFPLVLYQYAPDYFSFEQCRFHVHKQREGTSRVVMWVMGVFHSYTLEVSFAGSMLGCRRGTHFSTSDYVQFACHFCNAMTEYFDESKCKLAWRSMMLQQLLRNGSTADEPVKPLTFPSRTRRDSDSSGESSMSEEQVNEKQKKTSSLEKVIEKAEMLSADLVKENAYSVIEELELKLDPPSGPKTRRRRRRHRVPQPNETQVKEKPRKLPVWQPPVRRRVRSKKKLVRKRRVSESSSLQRSDTWRVYEDKCEERNRQLFMPSIDNIRPGSLRRTRLRSLLNLQRSIMGQAILLHDSSPVHKRLAKNILKETEAITEVLARELQLVSSSRKSHNAKPEPVEKKNKPAHPSSPGRPHPSVVIPFRLSIRSTTPTPIKDNRVMVP